MHVEYAPHMSQLSIMIVMVIFGAAFLLGAIITDIKSERAHEKRNRHE